MRSRVGLHVVIVATTAVALLVPGTMRDRASAAAGAPHSGFHHRGTAPYDVREGGAVHDLALDDVAEEVVAQGDGRLLVAGSTHTSWTPREQDAVVLRVLPTGAPDPTFGIGGVARVDTATEQAPADESFAAVSTAPDGKVVAAGSLYDNFDRYSLLIARFTAAGVLDLTFGGDGVVVIDHLDGFDEFATDVLVDSDGAVIVGTAAIADDGSTQRRALMRLNAAGLVDMTYGGGDGTADTTLGATTEELQHAHGFAAGVPLLAWQGANVVVAGSSTPVSAGGVNDVDVQVERYLPNGSRDVTFGVVGMARADVDGQRRVDHPNDLVVASDGTITLSAATAQPDGEQGAVVQLTANGATRTAFDADGSRVLRYPALRSWSVRGVGVQPDGRIVVGGGGNDRGAASFDFRFARVTPTGHPDPVFDGDGFARLDATQYDNTRDLVISDARAIAAGWSSAAPDMDIALGAIDLQHGPLPSVSIADVRMVEGEEPGGGQLRIPVRLSAPVAHRTSVRVRTADIDTSFDYFHVDGTLVFEPGETEVLVHISVADDATDENDEQFRIVLHDPERLAIADGESVVTIVDEDPGPAITAGDVSAVEGSMMRFVFNLSEASPAPIRFIAATAPATASEGADYTYSRREYEIPPGETSATFEVPTSDDADEEDNESLRVRLYEVDNARSYQEPTGTITDNDDGQAPPPSGGSGGSGDSGGSDGSGGSGEERTRPNREGYWMIGRTGDVYAFGDAGWHGNVDEPAGTQVVDLEPTATGNGYWTVTDRGHVYAHGDARWFGGSPVLGSGELVTSLSRSADGRGYWLFTSKGRVLDYGSALHHGDMSGRPLNGPVLDSIPTASGRGYYMVASDGGIFTFGDATFLGSMGGRHLNSPVQSLVPDQDGRGYWLVAGDGGIFSFDAPFYGSMGGTRLNRPITGMVGFGAGYLMVAEDGGIFSFGEAPFRGSLGANPPAQPIVSVAVLSQP